MPNTNTMVDSDAVIAQAMETFGIDGNMQTNPAIMRAIIKEFKLDSFSPKHRIMRDFLRDAATKPQTLGPMLSSIKKGVQANPAIMEFITLALEKEWFSPSPHIVRAVHVIYLLEALTAAMSNSHNFFMEMFTHYRQEERRRGINMKHLLQTFLKAVSVSRDLFSAVKAISVDPALVYFRFQRGFTKSQWSKYELKRMLGDNAINFFEYALLSPTKDTELQHVNELVRVNIYEAGVTEYKRGLKDNAVCAHELAESVVQHPPTTLFKNKCILPRGARGSFYKLIVERSNRFPTISYSQDWVNIYNTWNMAFILYDVEDLDIVLPKLLIPSVLNAQSDNFIGVRCISLWLTINHVYFRRCDHYCLPSPENSEEMAKAWAAINKKYAMQLVSSETGEDPVTFMNGYQRFFAHPVFNLLRLMKHLLLQ